MDEFLKTVGRAGETMEERCEVLSEGYVSGFIGVTREGTYLFLISWFPSSRADDLSPHSNLVRSTETLHAHEGTSQVHLLVY